MSVESITKYNCTHSVNLNQKIPNVRKTKKTQNTEKGEEGGKKEKHTEKSLSFVTYIFISTCAGMHLQNSPI